MSGLDEFLIHNHPHPVRVMWTSDMQAYERMWFTCQDTHRRPAGGGRHGHLPQPGHGRGVRHRQRPGPAHHGPGPPEAGSQPHGHVASGPSASSWWSRSASGGCTWTRTSTASPSTSRGSTPSAPSTASSVAACSSGPSPSPAWPATTASVGRRAGSPPTASGSSSRPRRLPGHPRPPLGHPRRGRAVRPCGAGTSIPTPESGWSSRSTGCGATTSSTTWATERRGSDTLRGRRHRLRFETGHPPAPLG